MKKKAAPGFGSQSILCCIYFSHVGFSDEPTKNLKMASPWQRARRLFTRATALLVREARAYQGLVQRTCVYGQGKDGMSEMSSNSRSLRAADGGRGGPRGTPCSFLSHPLLQAELHSHPASAGFTHFFRFFLRT